MKSEAPVYQLKLALVGSKPRVWRRLLVAAETPLDELHHIFQIVMGWEHAHLHQFHAGGKRGGAAYWPAGMASLGEPDEPADEAGVPLTALVAEPGDRLLYEYDFGDGWEHAVTLEKVLPADGKPLPRCTGGRFTCPPEDCGGVWGYANLLEAMTDPDHPEHEEFEELYGDPVDPDAFDRAAVNAVLHGAGSDPGSGP